MSFLLSILANKSLTVVLLLWGVSAAYGWVENYKNRLQWQQAAESYQDAYADQKNQYEQLDSTMRTAALQRRDIHAKSNTALEGLNSVARSEVRKKMGGDCGPYGQRVVPLYYVNILRLAAQQTPNRSEAKKQSSTQRIVARLRAAFTRQSNAKSGGVREEPTD